MRKAKPRPGRSEKTSPGHAAASWAPIRSASPLTARARAAASGGAGAAPWRYRAMRREVGRRPEARAALRGFALPPARFVVTTGFAAPDPAAELAAASFGGATAR